jgi:hypothetical protein
MGCGIHLAVQRRNGDRWERVERVREQYGEVGREKLYNGRNYVVFAALAGVRNGYGFAGCVTHDPLIPIAPERGFPLDFADQLVDDSHEGTWMGDHSFTWVTLDEIEAYDWSRDLLRSGWVSGPDRASQLKSGLRRPPEWCGGVSGANIRHLAIAELDAEIRSGKVDSKAYAELTWTESLSYACEDFIKLLPCFRALADKSEDVRLVMGFDS